MKPSKEIPAEKHPPEGFGLKDEVTFDQLPEQIRERYVDPKFGTEALTESLWLKETKAVLMFSPPPPYKPWTEYSQKTKDGWVCGSKFVA
jgi:hypothetical protein